MRPKSLRPAARRGNVDVSSVLEGQACSSMPGQAEPAQSVQVEADRATEGMGKGLQGHLKDQTKCSPDIAVLQTGAAWRRLSTEVGRSELCRIAFCTCAISLGTFWGELLVRSLPLKLSEGAAQPHSGPANEATTSAGGPNDRVPLTMPHACSM